MESSENAPVDEGGPATLEDARHLVHQLAAAVARLAADVRATRADADQDAIELRARTRWLEGRIEALEATLREQAGSETESTIKDRSTSRAEGTAPSPSMRATKAGAEAKRREGRAARIKATMSAEEIERLRAEKKAQRGKARSALPPRE